MDPSPTDPTHLTPLIPAPLRDRYQPVREIGEGGMGRVLLARVGSGETLVAVKRLSGEVTESRRARFLREAEILAELRHPTIPSLLSHGEDDQGPYLVMQYVQGTSLDELDDREQAVEALKRVTGALDALHERGLVHRDVKPANVMLDGAGHVFLVDMGLVFDPTASRLSGTGATAGTVGYVAPELFMEKPASPASDWFAWGASLFNLREYSVPYTLPEVVRAAAGLPLPEPPFQRMDPECAEADVIRACLALSPRDRPSSGVAVRDMLAAGKPPRPEYAQAAPPEEEPKPDPATRPAATAAPDPSAEGIHFQSEEILYIGFDADDEED